MKVIATTENKFEFAVHTNKANHLSSCQTDRLRGPFGTLSHLKTHKQPFISYLIRVQNSSPPYSSPPAPRAGEFTYIGTCSCGPHPHVVCLNNCACLPYSEGTHCSTNMSSRTGKVQRNERAEPQDMQLNCLAGLQAEI